MQMPGSIGLGPRLELVASMVPEQAKLGDIGTDHAYLPIFLWEHQRITRAIAVDVHEGPFKSAKSAIRARGLEQRIDVRFGDGLMPIQPGEVDTLTLAGMGGNTMLEIFEASPDVLAKVNVLIVQPQGAEGKVRKTLLNSGWLLQEEHLIAEDGRIYGVMLYSRTTGKSLGSLETLKTKWLKRLDKNWQENEHQENEYQEELEAFDQVFWGLGPLILEEPIPELERLIQEQIEPLKRAIQGMKKSQKEEIQLRIKKQELTCSLLEEMKKCLFPSA